VLRGESRRILRGASFAILCGEFEGAKPMIEEKELTGRIIECAMKVHSVLGPGLLESAYEACLLYELRRSGLEATNQVELPLVYGEVHLDVGYRIDVVVERRVIVELKSVESVAPIHKAQLLSHLKLSGMKVGLLINFNVVHLRDGITRMVN
jgi:GxxExxY protein